MYFSSLAEFVAMGGHGVYVWLAYAVFAVIMCANLVVPVVQGKQRVRQLAQRLKREETAS